MLYPHLNNLLSALHVLACVPPDPEPTSIKNHNELMRCFDIIGMLLCKLPFIFVLFVCITLKMRLIGLLVQDALLQMTW